MQGALYNAGNSEAEADSAQQVLFFDVRDFEQAHLFVTPKDDLPGGNFRKRASGSEPQSRDSGKQAFSIRHRFVHHSTGAPPCGSPGTCCLSSVGIFSHHDSNWRKTEKVPLEPHLLLQLPTTAARHLLR